MLEKLTLIQNIGQFENCDNSELPPFSKVSVIFGENGRGKTTIASILRSLATNDAEIIKERKRLGSTSPIKTSIEISGESFTYSEESWNKHFPNIKIFDDYFVQQNICSGLTIDTEQRQNLHELILGEKGVELNSKLLETVSKIEEHNKKLRERDALIPAEYKGQLSTESFCDLIEIADVDNQIQEIGRKISACNAADEIKNKQIFPPISTPTFDIEDISRLLETQLADIQSEATECVKNHCTKLGDTGEEWISEGIQIHSSKKIPDNCCPFCDQDLSNSSIFSMYQHYFGQAYEKLKLHVSTSIENINTAQRSATLERELNLIIQLLEFWKRFTDVPGMPFSTEHITNNWKDLNTYLLSDLQKKKNSPLEKITLSKETLDCHKQFLDGLKNIKDFEVKLIELNGELSLIKESAKSENLSALNSDLKKLKANKARFSEPTKTLCNNYKSEKAAKKLTEELRDQTIQLLDEYRDTIFQKYESSINDHLRDLNAAFRLSSVSSVNNRGGSSCNYSVLVNNEPVSITADSGPSFKNTLSAGDRNTLALAFFFASLDHDDQIESKIMVIDDPMTSLDEGRIHATIQHIKFLSDRVDQTIILSHSKPFLLQFWDSSKARNKSPFKIYRQGNGSSICKWDITQDSITEHDKRCDLILDLLKNGHSENDRTVAVALRPSIEAFLRVSYSPYFRPGDLLGDFTRECDKTLNTPNQILDENDLVELKNLTNYCNLFHHDTNSLGYTTARLNEGELTNYAQRTLTFIRK